MGRLMNKPKQQRFQCSPDSFAIMLGWFLKDNMSKDIERVPFKKKTLRGLIRVLRSCKAFINEKSIIKLASELQTYTWCLFCNLTEVCGRAASE
ncbi:hypothetical protein YC2023_083551 [Brassica napus]